MKKTSAYKCEGCNFYGTKAEVAPHEITCDAFKEKTIRKAVLEKQINTEKNRIRNTATCIEHIPELLTEYAKLNGVEVTINLEVVFQDCISNTHNCPIKGVRNWECDNKLPRHYPGFKGNITFTQTNKSKKSASDIFTHWHGAGVLGVNLGSGGGSSNSEYRYEVILFLEDFPIIEKKVQLFLKTKQNSLAHETSEKTKIATLDTLVTEKVKTDSIIDLYQDSRRDLQSQIQQLNQQVMDLASKAKKRTEDIRSVCLDENTKLLPKPNTFTTQANIQWADVMSGR